MGLRVSRSDTSGIPAKVYDALDELSPEFPEDWGASLIVGSNEFWELRLRGAPEGGVRSESIFPENQHVLGVQRTARRLRDS